MLDMTRSSFLLATLLAGASACGGNVVVDPGAGGAGGAGVATGPTSSANTAVTDTATGFGVTNSTGFGTTSTDVSTSTGFSSTNVATTSATGLTTASTSTGFNTDVSSDYSATSTTSSVSSSSGGDPCMTGANCASCPDAASCSMCNEAANPAGVPGYTALVKCVVCVGCYTTCDLAASSYCSGPPATVGPCDTGTPSSTTCDSCQQCAINGPCMSTLNACLNDAACNALLMGMQACPQG